MTARGRRARPRRTRAALRALAILALGLAALAGCGRRKFEPVRGDSTATLSPDSFAILARDIQGAWENGEGEDAAKSTARLLLQDLRMHAADNPDFDWLARANGLLDSLGVGAELAGGKCAMIANFFSRSDPSQGSWPWLYTCGSRTIDAQQVEGKNMKLFAVVSRGVPPTRGGPPSGVAALYGRRAGMGTQPILMSWTLPSVSRRWRLDQTLGADSLGGIGSADFQPSDTTIELVARTYRPAPRFDECASCPHVFGVRRVRWNADGWIRTEDRTLNSPYYTFVRFITALMVGDREMAESLVTDRDWVDFARRSGFGEARGNWRAAPSTDETAHEMVFLRGKDEAWRISFAQLEGEWRISGIASTNAAID